MALISTRLEPGEGRIRPHSSRFNGFMVALQAVETALSSALGHTGLKPGANERVRRHSPIVKIIATVTLSLLLFGCSKPSMSQQDLRTEVLTQLRRDGSDTSKPHGFDFYLYFPTETAARQASQRLAKEYRVEVRPAAKGPTWLCLAKTTLTPDTAPLAEMGSLFSQLAQEFRGEFDGWESDVVKR